MTSRSSAPAGTSLSRIPSDVWATLTEHQRTALVASVGDGATDHMLAIRSSVRLIGGRYYFAAFMGRERRPYRRLREEGQLALSEVFFTYVALAILIVLYALVPIYLLLSLLQSAAHVSFIPSPFALHAWLCR